MKKRIVSMSIAVLLLMSMLLISVCNTEAAFNDYVILDGSYLTQEEESIGYDTKITRGVDLLAGYSKVRKTGPGEIYAGGTTAATHTVASVQVAVMVERAKDEDEQWEFYDSWQKENINASQVSSSRILKVESGYYYRVRSVHAANSDVSSSFTNGIYIE